MGLAAFLDETRSWSDRAQGITAAWYGSIKATGETLESIDIGVQFADGTAGRKAFSADEVKAALTPLWAAGAKPLAVALQQAVSDHVDNVLVVKGHPRARSGAYGPFRAIYPD